MIHDIHNEFMYPTPDYPETKREPRVNSPRVRTLIMDDPKRTRTLCRPIHDPRLFPTKPDNSDAYTITHDAYMTCTTRTTTEDYYDTKHNPSMTCTNIH